MRVFQKAARERFVEATVDRIAVEHEDRYAELGRDGTRALVEEGIARAAGYGVRETGSVGAFIDLMLTVDREFELMPDLEGVLAVLQDDALSGEAKMGIVTEQMNRAFATR